MKPLLKDNTAKTSGKGLRGCFWFTKSEFALDLRNTPKFVCDFHKVLLLKRECERRIMKAPVVLIITICLLACTANLPPNVSRTEPDTMKKTASVKQPDAHAAAGPIKSPHGYIIDKDYEPGRFGGFVGDCTDDKNWPYFWQCMSENAGNGSFK